MEADALEAVGDGKAAEAFGYGVVMEAGTVPGMVDLALPYSDITCPGGNLLLILPGFMHQRHHADRQGDDGTYQLRFLVHLQSYRRTGGI